MISLKSINEFLSVKEMAIAGASRDKKKFGGMVFQELKERGYQLYPVNPNAETIDEIQCYKTVSDLPTSTTNLYIVTPKVNTAQIIKEAIAKGIRNIWIQQQSDSSEALELAKANGINLIYGC